MYYSPEKKKIEKCDLGFQKKVKKHHTIFSLCDRWTFEKSFEKFVQKSVAHIVLLTVFDWHKFFKQCA